MKITVNTTLFKRALQTIEKGLATKAVLPICKGVLIDARDNITLMSNNLEISIRTQVEGDIKEQGAIVIPGQDLIQHIRKVTTPEVTITTKSNHSVLVKSNGQYTIKGHDISDFPESKRITYKTTIPQATLKSAIEKTQFATSTDQTQPVLTGVRIEIENNEVSTAATNQYCFSMFNENEGGEIDENIIIPRMATGVLVNQLGDGEVGISYEEDFIEFALEDVVIQSRLITGTKFPNYKAIKVSEFATEFIVDKLQLESAVEKASLCNEEKTIKMVIEGDKLTISGQGNYKNYSEDIEISKTGDDLVTGFDSKYIINYIKTVDADRIFIKSAGALAPWIFKESEDDVRDYLVMPVRVV